MNCNLFFDTFKQWWMCLLYSLELLVTGLGKLMYALVFGVLSVFRWLWNLTVIAVKEFPKAAIIVAIAAIFFTWMFTFVRYRARVSAAEFQRDSTAFRLKQFESMYADNTDSLIIVRKNFNDTLTFHKPCK